MGNTGKRSLYFDMPANSTNNDNSSESVVVKTRGNLHLLLFFKGNIEAT
jgi:hypothetical protein